MLEQSVSKGTLEDVVQLVHRDFAAAQVDAAFALLGAHEASNPARGLKRLMEEAGRFAAMNPSMTRHGPNSLAQRLLYAL